MKNRYLLPLILLLSLFLTARASAQEATQVSVTDDQVNAVAKELYCPECENIPLDVCPSQACADMRQEIREMLEQGSTKDQIKQYYVDRYGDRVLGAPPARGWNWLLYVIPPLGILVIVVLFYRAFRLWQRPAPQALKTPAERHKPPVATDDYVARLEAELKRAKK